MSNGIDRFIEIAENSSTDKEIQRYVMRTMVTGEILNTMEALGVNKSDLAAMLHCTKGHISRMLSGDRNLTLDSISDIAVALGIRVSFSAVQEGLEIPKSDCLEFVQASNSYTFSQPEGMGRLNYAALESGWGEKKPIKVA